MPRYSWSLVSGDDSEPHLNHDTHSQAQCSAVSRIKAPMCDPCRQQYSGAYHRKIAHTKTKLPVPAAATVTGHAVPGSTERCHAVSRHSYTVSAPPNSTATLFSTTRQHSTLLQDRKHNQYPSSSSLPMLTPPTRAGEYGLKCIGRTTSITGCSRSMRSPKLWCSAVSVLKDRVASTAIQTGSPTTSRVSTATAASMRQQLGRMLYSPCSMQHRQGCVDG